MFYFDKDKVYITEELYYKIYRIKKRVIFVPCDELKQKQHYMKRAINWIFPLKLNILKSAKIHEGKKWVLKLDIKDFYDSVPYEQIERVMQTVAKKIKNVDSNYYIRMTTIDSKLPTGAPTSAHIANACFLPIDRLIRIYCFNYGINYSRYMDDMTFSSDEKFYLNMIEKYVKRLLENEGYKLNKKKTRYISDNKQQNILGLVVNNGSARLSKDFRRKIRAMVHSYSICKDWISPIDIKHRIWDDKKKNELKGYLAYIKHVDDKFYNKIIIKYKLKPSALI